MSQHQFPDRKPLAISALYDMFADERVVFTYRGNMSEHITDSILSISENTLQEHTSLAPSNKKVSFLLVECFQNLLRHGDVAGGHGDENAMFSFRSFDNAFYINSINAIIDEDRARLKDMVERVNQLDKEGLTRLYRERLSTSTISEKGGAGLGLIELARKSGQAIRYSFTHEHDGHVNFHNQVSFRQPGVDERELEQATVGLSEAMLRSNTLLLYKGDLSQRSILPLLSMAELNSERLNTSRMTRRVGHVLIEMLQNISRHADSTNGLREGVLTIGMVGQSFLIQTGNFINSSQRVKLTALLKEVTSVGADQLRDLHRKKFRDSLTREDRYSSGLGIVQIARDSNGRIDFSIDGPENGTSFFTLSALV